LTTRKQCEECGSPFQARRRKARFCSAKCRKRAWVRSAADSSEEAGERVLTGTRRPTRDGQGTRLYVTAEEIGVIRGSLDANREAMHRSGWGAMCGDDSDLERKLDLAAERVQTKENA
jgi:hypothetical protein